jgi:hypothetical protein
MEWLKIYVMMYDVVKLEAKEKYNGITVDDIFLS